MKTIICRCHSLNKPQVQEIKKTALCHIVIIFLKSSDKEKILKKRNMQRIVYGGAKVSMTAELLL